MAHKPLKRGIKRVFTVAAIGAAFNLGGWLKTTDTPETEKPSKAFKRIAPAPAYSTWQRGRPLLPPSSPDNPNHSYNAGHFLSLRQNFFLPPTSPALRTEELPAQTPAPAYDADREKSALLWKRILRERSTPFLDAPPTQTYFVSRLVTGSKIKAVQVESTFTNAADLLLLSDSNTPLDIDRHGEACANIIDQSAGNGNVETHSLRFHDSSFKWLSDMNNENARALFHNADVISISMAIPRLGNQTAAFSHGELHTEDQVRQADEFWKVSRAISVAAAGNSGDSNSSDVERVAAYHMMRADTHLLVGELRNHPQEGDYIAAHSSRTPDISFVTANPFFEGYRYRYYKNEDDFRKELDHFYDTVPNSCQQSGQEIFKQSLQILPDSLLKARLESCHPQFDRAAFEGKDILKKDLDWIRKNPDEVLGAFKNGLIAHYKAASRLAAFRDGDVGIDGRTSFVPGTSFATPNAAGMIADMRSQFPGLDEYTIAAAALLAAEPVAKQRLPDGAFARIIYTDNGRNIPFNSAMAGFGALEKDNLVRVTRRMAMLLDETPTLSQAQKTVQSDTVTYDKPQDSSSPLSATVLADDNDYTDYKVTLDEKDDIIALSTHLCLRFKGDKRDIPLKVTLISPAGGRVQVTPTRLQTFATGQQADLSLTRSVGHMGVHTAGTWTVRVHHGYIPIELASAQLTVKGMEKDGLVDAYIQRYGGDTPLATREEIVQQEIKALMSPGLQTLNLPSFAAPAPRLSY